MAIPKLSATLLESTLNNLDLEIYLVDQDYTLIYTNKKLKQRLNPIREKKCYQQNFHRETPCPWCKIIDMDEAPPPFYSEVLNPIDHRWDKLTFTTTTVDTKQYYIISVTDLSYEKNLSIKLKRSDDLFKSIFETIPVGIFFSTPDGKFLDVNPALAHMFDYTTPREMIDIINQTNIAKQMYVESDRRPNMVNAALNNEGWQTSEETYYSKEKRIVKANLIYRAVRREDGLIDHIEGFVEDITEKKELEKLKENFIATLTHDLRVPLIAVSNTLNLFIKGSYGNLTPQQSEAVINILNSNNDLLILVNTLLEGYKMESGQNNLFFESIDSMDLIQKCITELSPLITENSTKEVILENVSIPKIKGDKVALKRVFMNLISNSIDHTGDDVTIKIEANQKNNLIQFRIKDNGPGIPKKELKNIFGRYFTGLKKFRKIGTGLGLYLSKQIIVAHHGKIWAESEESIGTTFFIELPIANEDF